MQDCVFPKLASRILHAAYKHAGRSTKCVDRQCTGGVCTVCRAGMRRFELRRMAAPNSASFRLLHHNHANFPLHQQACRNAGTERVLACRARNFTFGSSAEQTKVEPVSKSWQSLLRSCNVLTFFPRSVEYLIAQARQPPQVRLVLDVVARSIVEDLLFTSRLCSEENTAPVLLPPWKLATSCPCCSYCFTAWRDAPGQISRSR